MGGTQIVLITRFLGGSAWGFPRLIWQETCHHNLESTLATSVKDMKINKTEKGKTVLKKSKLQMMQSWVEAIANCWLSHSVTNKKNCTYILSLNHLFLICLECLDFTQYTVWHVWLCVACTISIGWSQISKVWRPLNESPAFSGRGWSCLENHCPKKYLGRVKFRTKRQEC